MSTSHFITITSIALLNIRKKLAVIGVEAEMSPVLQIWYAPAPSPTPAIHRPKRIQSLQGGSSYTTSSSTNMVAYYSYDGYGNLLSKGDVGFNGASYTYAGGAPESRPTRLLSVSSSHGTQTFTYDGKRQRNQRRITELYIHHI